MNERPGKAKQDNKDRRAERLARALRENLKRRKAQARGRDRLQAAVSGSDHEAGEPSGS